MSQLRFGFLWGAVWVCLFVLVVGPWWVGLFGSGSYPLIRLFEFIQGDLRLGTHSARTRAKKPTTNQEEQPVSQLKRPVRLREKR